MSAPGETVPRDLPAVSVILLGGLPGSGKTHYARQLAREGWRLFDDFQNRAKNDSAAFADSRHFDELVEALRNGELCVVADIRVIHAPYREDAQRTLRQQLGAIRFEFHLFANDPVQCAQNVRNDTSDRRMESRLEAIGFWSAHHSVPPGAKVLSVWRP